MPKKPTPHNPRNRTGSTVRSAGDLLHRVKSLGEVRVATATPATAPAGAAASALELARQALPLELRPHLVGCLEKPGELVLFAPSAAWAGRLKLALGDAPPRTDGRRVTVRILPHQL